MVNQMVAPLPLIPTDSRALHDPPQVASTTADPAAHAILYWEAAGNKLRLIARRATAPPCGIDLGLYTPAARTQLQRYLWTRCQSRPATAAGKPISWHYRAGCYAFRPLLDPGGVLCFLQADGWINLVAEVWPGHETCGHPLGRFSIWEVLHWLGSPPVPPPTDEESAVVLPGPLAPEIDAAVTWWTAQVHLVMDEIANRREHSPALLPDYTHFTQALAVEIHTHLNNKGWDMTRPEWRAAERALGLHEHPDPILTHAAFTAGLWTTLAPIWGRHPPHTQMWINPGQVWIAPQDQPPQILWPLDAPAR